jgi:integrase
MANKRAKFPGLYWDAKTGKGEIDKRVNGRRVRERFEAGSQREAEDIYLRAIGGAKERQATAASPTHAFREAATKYLNEEFKKSLARDADSLAMLDAWIGGMALEQIHQGTLQPFIDARRADGIKSLTVCRDLAVVSRILNLAARVWRNADGQPWLRTAPPLLRPPAWDDQAKPYPLDRREERALLQAMPRHLADMCLFGLNTGARESVICSLRWEWMQRLPGITVFVVPGKGDSKGWKGTKNGTDFLLVLNDIALAVVEAQPKVGSHVFNYHGEPILRINNTAWRRAWTEAGLPEGRDVLSGPHNMRHTFARRLRQQGVRQETISTLLHHADGNVTLHYAQAEIKELHDAVQALCRGDEQPMLRAVG